MGVVLAAASAGTTEKVWSVVSILVVLALIGLVLWAVRRRRT